MNARIAKTLRSFAKYRILPYRVVKRVWENSSREEQLATLPQMKKVIEMGKDVEKKGKEMKYDKTTDNK